MTDKTPLHVFSLPRMSHNPYQKLLAQNLESQHVLTEIAPRGMVAFAKKLIVTKADIIHIHFLHFLFQTNRNKKMPLFFSIMISALFLFILRIKIFLGAHIVLTAHNVTSHEHFHPKLELALLRYISKIASRIIVHFPEGQEIISTRYKIPLEKTVCIPHGSYTGYYRNTATANESRIKLAIPTEAFVFLYFGNIRTYKGLPELIAAFKDIQQPLMRLYIVGNPTHDEIKHEIQKLVEHDSRISCIFSFIPEDEIQYYMNAADCVVLPYREIFTSGTALLAAAFKKIIIAPDQGSLHQFKDAAFLYDSNNPHGLYDALLQARHFTMHPTNVEVESWEAIAKKTAEVYYLSLHHAR